jgi:hypothetical protein
MHSYVPINLICPGIRQPETNMRRSLAPRVSSLGYQFLKRDMEIKTLAYSSKYPHRPCKNEVIQTSRTVWVGFVKQPLFYPAMVGVATASCHRAPSGLPGTPFSTPSVLGQSLTCPLPKTTQSRPRDHITIFLKPGIYSLSRSRPHNDIQ